MKHTIINIGVALSATLAFAEELPSEIVNAEKALVIKKTELHKKMAQYAQSIQTKYTKKGDLETALLIQEVVEKHQKEIETLKKVSKPKSSPTEVTNDYEKLIIGKWLMKGHGKNVVNDFRSDKWVYDNKGRQWCNRRIIGENLILRWPNKPQKEFSYSLPIKDGKLQGFSRAGIKMSMTRSTK